MGGDRCGGPLAGAAGPLLERVLWEDTGAAGENLQGGSARAGQDGRRWQSPGVGGGGRAGTSRGSYWTRVDLARTGSGTNRANGDRGATARGGALAESWRGDRKGNDAQCLDSWLRWRGSGWSRELGRGFQRSPRVLGGAVGRVGGRTHRFWGKGKWVRFCTAR